MGWSRSWAAAPLFPEGIGLGQEEGLGTGWPTLVQLPACRVTSGKGLPFSEPQQSCSSGFLLGGPCSVVEHAGRRPRRARGGHGAGAQEADGGGYQRGRKP